MSKLEQNDGPGCDGKQDEDDEDDLGQQRGPPDQLEHPAAETLLRRAHAGRLEEGKRVMVKSTQRTLRKSDSGTQRGPRNFVKLARAQEPVKRMIRWSFHRFDAILAAVSPPPRTV